MKKKFTLLIAALALLTMIVQPGKVMGQTSVTFIAGVDTGETSVTKNGITVSMSTMSRTDNYRTYANTDMTVSSTVGNIQSVVVTCTANGTSSYGPGKFSVSTNSSGSYTYESNGPNGTWTGTSDEMALTASAQVRMTQIVVTYDDGGSSLVDNDLALTSAPVELSFDLYNNSDAQVISYTTSSTGAVTIANNNYVETEVNQVNKTITVTPAAITNGAKTITVNQAADDNYYAGSTTFTVNITNSAPSTGGDVTFDATVDMGTSPIIKNGVTFACTNGVLNNGSEYRLYKNSVTTFRVESTSGNSITQIAFTGTSSNPASGFATQDGWTTNGNNGTWTGSAQEVSFTASGAQVRATKIVVTVATSGSDPYITTSNVDIAYDATAGNIQYEIVNPVEGASIQALVAEGATITNFVLGTPADGVVHFTCDANATNAIKTATVTLNYKNGNETLATKEVTVTQAGNPNALNNIYDINAVGSQYHVKGQVVATNARGFVIGDGTGYVYTYLNDVPTYTVGDLVDISGTTGSYGHIIQFTNTATLTEATETGYDGNPAYTVITEVPNYSEGYHLSDYFQFEGTLSKETSGNYTNYNIAVGNGIIRISYPTTDQVAALENLLSKIVRVQGFFAGISGTTFTVMMESIEEIVTPTISINPTAANPFTYVQGAGPSEDQVFEVTGENLTSNDIVATITTGAEYFEMTDDETYSSTVTVNSGDYISVRLKAGLALGNEYAGVLTLTNEGAENVTVDLSGSVTGATYTINLDDQVVGGTIEADKTSAAAGETVTITATADNGYELDEWIVEDEDSTPIAVTGTNPATFEMPAKDVLVSATFTAKPTYAITKVVTPENTGTVVTDATAWEGKSVLVLVEPETGYSLTNIVVGKTADLTVTTAITGNVTDGFTFTMPAYPVTVTATFAAADVLTGSEVYNAMNSKSYTAWELVKTYATYKGQSNDVQDYIQLRYKDENNNYSGIVTTATSGYARKVSVTYAATNTNDRYLTVYGKNTPYEDPADLYDNEKRGTSLGTITFNTNDVSDELTITGDYQYIGLLASGAMYFEPIIITWDPVTLYDVIFDEAQTGGTISVSPTSAVEGETITLTATPAEHYEFTSWTVEDENSDPVEVTGTNPATFLMPASDVTVEATFTALSQYDITIPAAIEDYIMVDATGNKAYAGETVTISVVDTPAGKVLSTLTVIGDTSGDEIEISPEVSASIDEYTFEMPAENVTINATFGDLPKYTVTFYVNGTLDNNLTINNITPGNSINLPASSALTPEGFSLVGWATEGSAVAVANPYTPENNITLYALLQNNNPIFTYSYVKVTSDLGTDWAGDYLIAYSDEIFADGRVGGTGTNGIGCQNVSVDLSDDISDNTIPSPNGDLYRVTLEEISENSNTYVLRTQDGKYNYQTANSNGLVSSDKKETAAAYPITITFTSADDIKLCLGGNAEGAVFRYNTSGYFRYYKNGGQSAVYLYKRIADAAPNFNNVTVFNDPLEPEPVLNDPIPETTCVIVGEGTTLTLNGANNGTAANLIIEDGGQLIHDNPVNATIQRNVTGHSNSKDNDNSGYQLIASPVESNLDVEAQTNLTEGDYDLYYFDHSYEHKEWRNYKKTDNPEPFTSIKNGIGYLYANTQDITISFSGELKPSLNVVQVDLAYVDGKPFSGWNLVGNPFACNAYIIGATEKVEAYYKMNDNGNGFVASTDAIDPMEGIFVQASATDQSFFFTRNEPSKGVSNLNLQVAQVVNNRDARQATDNAIIRFDGGNTLEKFSFSEDNAKLYIPQNGKDYAVVSADTQGEMPVNFKAAENGTYTIEFSMDNVEFSYLHLIDNKTGMDIDLLQTSSYTFEASKIDYASRFKLVFSTNSNSYSNDDNDFAFFDANGNLLILGNEGTATLQVIDITGRTVSNETFSGNYSKAINAKAGVYMLRLIQGNDVRTQKIVVR